MKENKNDIYPLRFKTLEVEQNKDKDLMAEIRKENHPYTLNTFRGGGRQVTLLCKNDKIVVPKSLQQRIARWYHVNLMHPGIARTVLSIKKELLVEIHG